MNERILDFCRRIAPRQSRDVLLGIELVIALQRATPESFDRLQEEYELRGSSPFVYQPALTRAVEAEL